MDIDYNLPIFTMLVGIPASGKSTYAEKLSKETGAIICSSDKVREEICGDINSQDKNNEVFITLHRRIKEHLRNGESVIYDACNISSKRRIAFLRELKNISCKKHCVIIATPYEKCLEANKNRERQVPEDVIKRMYMNWNVPYWFEGWDRIWIKYPIQDYWKYYGIASNYISENGLYNYDQKNSHHTLSLGAHLDKTLEIISENPVTDYVDMRVAASLHDIGKPFTQTFVDSKGNPSNDAHYYQHHCVSAYNAMFFMHPDKLNYCILINLHMQPYFWEKDKEHGDKTQEKYRKLWGDKLFNKVMALHAADKAAH